MNKYICSPAARQTPPTPSQEGNGCAVCREFTPFTPLGHLPLTGEEWKRAISLFFVLALLFGALAALSALTACTDINTDFRQTDDPYITISVTIPTAQTPSTRAIAGGGGEAEVITVDLLVFENTGAGETLAQHVIGESPTASSSDDGRRMVKFKARLATNPHATTIAIIANAATSVSNAVNVVTLGADKASVMESLTFVSTGTTGTALIWNTTSSTNYTPIPMYGEYNVEEGGITPEIKVQEVELIRMLARMDVVNNDADFTLTNVQVVNYQTAGYIAPSWTTEKPMIPASSVHRTGLATNVPMVYTATNGAIAAGTIYTYEAPATNGKEGTDGHTNAMCLLLQGTYQGTTYYYRLDFTNPQDSAGIAAGQEGFDPTRVGYIPVLRNHLYSYTINEIGPGHSTAADALSSLGIMNNLKASLMVVDESLLSDFVFNGEHYLGTQPLDTLSANADTKEILIATNYTTGWVVDHIEIPSNMPVWLTATKVEGDVKRTNLKLTATANDQGYFARTAYVHIRAGRIIHKVKVVQQWSDYGIGAIINPGRSYVGAFWRHNQRGERLIRIPVTNESKGTWSVRVWDYGEGFTEGDILLDDKNTEDPGVYFNNATSERHTDPDEGGYYVEDDRMVVTGNAASTGSYIYFRVGLKDTIPLTHRYARLILTYANNTKFQMIYLRAGDSPDQLMDNNDPLTIDGATKTRASRRFSPYNTTSSSLSDTNPQVTVVAGNGDFTKYPSQAGALFQYAHTVNPRMAYHPIKAPTGFSSTESKSTSYSASYNTCPSGYVRATANGTASSNHYGHSLTLNFTSTSSAANAKNSAWGYLADGFFDRLTIGTSYTKTEYSAVRVSNYNVAYRGRLFFNPLKSSIKYNASIFFPAAGSRTNASVTLNAGTHVYYWGTSHANINYCYHPTFTSGNPAFMNFTVNRYAATTLRCIRS